MTFNFKKLEIPDVVLVEPQTFDDDRGFFLESYKKSVFFENGIKENFLQDNVSYSKKNVIRGLHYQTKPKEQAKLVSVISGKIFDVAVDIRKDSQTFGKWTSHVLSDKNHNMLFIPDGFAHGFCVMSEYAIVHYKVTNEYSPENSRGIIWNDAALSISWPTSQPLVSDQDRKLPSFSNST